ncbi:MAG: sigma-70 family RNA polymerase sigma factor [Lachnospiraceae bacterium]|nr:sigma-70 family RNA polymerase sigma factor [Agathobacter sp.]MDD6444331.1 sigma-70 family RNA polymerase sigma factor [Lachnospiraceae bacterium]MDY4893210.1 sigma-70 family RNA polymerase sigma factor [Agathobacter sp.]
MNYETCSDEELIQRLRQGENTIMDYILEKYKPLVRKCANAMYLIGGETEDLIQEGMIGLFKAIRDYRDDRDNSFSSFAYICVNRQLYTAIEASNRKKNQPLNSYVSLSEQSTKNCLGVTSSPEQLVIEQEVWENLWKELDECLSEMEKQVLSYYLKGSSYLQIAEKMEKSPKSIDNALWRIRQKIRQIKQVS